MNVMHLISGGDTGGAKTHLFELLDKLKYKCNVTMGCLMQGQFYKEILDRDVESVLFEQKNRFDLSVLEDILKFLSDRKTEILHVHGARANFIARFLKKKINIPIVSTMHSDYLLDFDSFVKKHLFTKLNVWAIKNIDYFIAVSDSFKDMLISRGFRPNDINVVYNGMDYSRIPSEVTSKENFAAKYGITIEPGCIYVGIAARFDAVKKVDLFIEGAAKAYAKNKNLRFVIAGSGVEEKHLKELVGRLGMDGVIKFLGFVTDMYGFLNFIDINTLTSLRESFPYSMLEGAAMRKPMVASRVGGIPALVEDGETGYLFESKNADDMSEKLLLLASDSSKIKEMGENIYKKVTTCFSSEKFADDHIKIYNKILADYGSDKKYDFVLSGYYGFNNSGDDALLLALINDLKARRQDVRIAVLSSKPRQTRAMYRTDSFGRISPWGIYSLFKKSKVLLSGGGSLIQDETSSKSLWYYLWIISTAKRCGMSVMQIANGIGPVKRAKNRKLASDIINRDVDRITLREEKSYKQIRDMNINVETEITADPAISLEPVDESKVRAILEANGIPEGEYICVSVRKWKVSESRFERTMAEAFDYAAKKYGKNIVMIPMQYPIDIEISKSIISKMRTKAYCIETPCTICETIGIIKHSSLVIAMRLHSLVYAVSCGVGVIAVKYDPKIDGFMEYFRQSRIADVSTVTPYEMMHLIDDYFSEDSKSGIMDLCEEMKEKAKRNADIAVEILEKYDNEHK